MKVFAGSASVKMMVRWSFLQILCHDVGDASWLAIPLAELKRVPPQLHVTLPPSYPLFWPLEAVPCQLLGGWGE